MPSARLSSITASRNVLTIPCSEGFVPTFAKDFVLCVKLASPGSFPSSPETFLQPTRLALSISASDIRQISCEGVYLAYRGKLSKEGPFSNGNDMYVAKKAINSDLRQSLNCHDCKQKNYFVEGWK